MRALTRGTELGAVPIEGGRTRFRVWAPHARAVALRSGGAEHPLDRAEEGVWEAELDLRAGDDYVYVLDEERVLPDPCSRFQPEGVRGPSRVVDPGSQAQEGGAVTDDPDAHADENGGPRRHVAGRRGDAPADDGERGAEGPVRPLEPDDAGLR